MRQNFPTFFLSLAVAVLFLASTVEAQQPKPIGATVELGGHKLHIHCSGRGAPTVIIENGFDEFSFDWMLAQQQVEKFTRVCTYDRAGYAWSTPGPLPRTYSQINLDLHNALRKLGEKAPYVLVGHSFGGPVIRNYALLYRNEVAGLVFAEAVGDAHRISMGKKTARIADFAQGRAIPAPHEQMLAGDQPKLDPVPPQPQTIEPPFDRLPSDLQKLHLWAVSQPSLQAAENSERDWSPEYLANWLKTNQAGSLGNLPIIVLARANGGYGNDLDMPADELERLRRKDQEQLAELSSRGKLLWVDGGHEIELENPEAVVRALRELELKKQK